jgi:hypothetical protein
MDSEQGDHLLVRKTTISDAVGPSRIAALPESAALQNIRGILSNGRTATVALHCVATGDRNRPVLYLLCLPG